MARPRSRADDGGGGEDMISRLPDCVLGEILTRLPICDAVRVAVLSSRWRHVWRATPLNLDIGGAARVSAVCLVTHVLAVHPGPARRLRLETVYVAGHSAEYDFWLRSRALDGLQVLEIQPGQPCINWRRRTTPPPVFRFASSLRALRIGNCTFPSSTAAADAPPLRFPPHLELISFCSINISEAALHGLIASCPNLVTLVLDECMGFAEVMINSSTLRTFAFSAAHSLNPMNIAQVRMHRVVIENAPRLENLAQFRHPGIPESFELLVASAPKLKFLGCISKNISRLELGTTVFKVTNCRAQHLPNGGVQSEQIRTKMQAVTLGATLRTVKSLALEDVDRTNVVCSLLRCFPCLEKLYISSTQGFRVSGSYGEQIPVECLELHLRIIVLSGYDGKKPADVWFARFFVRHARVLELMRIRCRSNSYFETTSEQWQVRIEKKASRDAKLRFVHDYGHNYILTCQSISMMVRPRGTTHLIHGLSNSSEASVY